MRKNKLFYFVTIGFVLFGLGGCGFLGQKGDYCQYNSDCNSRHFCDKKISQCNRICRTNAQCPAGKVCYKGRCAAPKRNIASGVVYYEYEDGSIDFYDDSYNYEPADDTDDTDDTNHSQIDPPNDPVIDPPPADDSYNDDYDDDYDDDDFYDSDLDD